MSDINMMIAETALDNMFKRGYLDITAVRTVAELLGKVQQGPAWLQLSALHYVDFDKMPQELRVMVPDLIREALEMPEFQFSLKPKVVTLSMVEEVPKARPRWRLLGG